MKLNKIVKIIIAIMMIALITICTSQAVFADTEAKDKPAATGVTSYDPTNSDFATMFTSSKDTSGASQAAGNIIGMIINIAQVIGTGVAIIMLIVLAIQYIAASPEGKAEIKKNSTVYIVGAVILFAASGLLGIIRRFAVKSVGSQGAETKAS